MKASKATTPTTHRGNGAATLRRKITLTPDRAADAEAAASRRGQGFEDYVRDLIERDLRGGTLEEMLEAESRKHQREEEVERRAAEMADRAKEGEAALALLSASVVAAIQEGREISLDARITLGGDEWLAVARRAVRHGVTLKDALEAAVGAGLEGGTR